MVSHGLKKYKKFKNFSLETANRYCFNLILFLTKKPENFKVYILIKYQLADF